MSEIAGVLADDRYDVIVEIRLQFERDLKCDAKESDFKRICG